MIILSTEKDEIRLSLGKTIKEKEDWLTDTTMYLPDLPKISCTSLDDAKYIQEKINSIITDIAQDRIK